jgi:hypothetical protein
MQGNVLISGCPDFVLPALVKIGPFSCNQVEFIPHEAR